MEALTGAGRGRDGDIAPDKPGLGWPTVRQAAEDGELTMGGAKEPAALTGGEAEGGAKEAAALAAWLPGGGEAALDPAGPGISAPRAAGA